MGPSIVTGRPWGRLWQDSCWQRRSITALCLIAVSMACWQWPTVTSAHDFGDYATPERDAPGCAVGQKSHVGLALASKRGRALSASSCAREGEAPIAGQRFLGGAVARETEGDF
jgi:hypothetical protein